MPYIIKAEINGIQEFIFNIKSKGAAKALKARSFLIDAICNLMEDIYTDAFPGSKKIFTGGGNVYIEVTDSEWDEERFQKITADVANDLIPYNLISSAVSLPYKELINYGKLIKDVNSALNKRKLQFGNNLPRIFEAEFDNLKEQKVYTDFSTTYAGCSTYNIHECTDKNKKLITDKYITVCNKQLSLLKGVPQKEKENRLLPLPIWNDNLLEKYKEYIKEKEKNSEEDEKASLGNIISFEYLAGFAQQRTGTDNIGILKLDIDNLGKLFQGLSDREKSMKLSGSIKDFFLKGIIELLNEKFGTYIRLSDKKDEEQKGLVEGKEKKIMFYKCNIVFDNSYKDNIYTVYAGGDDCFIIGAWDAIPEFAIALNNKFKTFEEKLRKDFLPEIKNPITLSASIILVDSHYPVVRFAEIAEGDLREAKKAIRRNLIDAASMSMKNNISFMGHVFSWDEFNEVVKVKNTFVEMIMKHGAPKAFVQRIIHSFESSDNLYWHKCKPSKPFNPAILWRFLYSFRDVKHEDYFIANYEAVFFSPANGYYKKYVIEYFDEGKKMSQVLPVAARWTELLCRK